MSKYRIIHFKEKLNLAGITPAESASPVKLIKKYWDILRSSRHERHKLNESAISIIVNSTKPVMLSAPDSIRLGILINCIARGMTAKCATDVAEKCCFNKMNKEIAGERTVNAVNAHMRNAFEVLDVTSFTDVLSIVGSGLVLTDTGVSVELLRDVIVPETTAAMPPNQEK